MTDGAAEPPATAADPRARSRIRRWLTWLLAVVGVVVVVVILWDQGERLINGQASGLGCYVIVVLLIFGDALFPVLPGETTLNAACVLAASGKLDLTAVMFCGALGAVTGDSTLYWLARKSRGRVRAWLDRAVDNKAGRSVVDMLHKHGAVFIVFGRYVPGVRFAINVTLGGVVRMPYRKFLCWSALSGTLWSITVCLSAYYISSALAGYPVLALVLSTCAGTVLIGSVIWVQRRTAKHREATAAVAH